jgi:quercetin dioxygenase-like cupin family protein
MRTFHHTKLFRIISVVFAFSIVTLLAQSGVQRNVVQRGDISVPGREAVVVRIEIAPGASTGRHTHAGDENTYVFEGELEVTIDGQAPKIIKAGEAIIIPGGTIHNAQNNGTQPLKAVGVYIVEKGKPMTTPAS